MNIILWDGQVWDNLLPFTFTRPAGLIRIGILTLEEKIQRYTGATPSHLTKDYLQAKYPVHIEDDNLVINAAALPNEDIIAQCHTLRPMQGLYYQENLVAARMGRAEVEALQAGTLPVLQKVSYEKEIRFLDKIWKIFSWNGEELEKDFELITRNRKSQPIPEGNFVRKPEAIFIEEGAIITNASLNAESGPIYIGKDAEIMEGSIVRGPFCLGEHSQLKLGAKIYGPTTVGPHSRVGGEVNNSVIFGYSNKGHDGFLGNSVLGEWCNIGADSNNSNLKNNYDEVKLWSYPKGSFERTGLQFCGLFMGDHSKCGINTMFNTGTVVGVSANIFGSGFPRNFIPSYSWGGASGFSVYITKKAFETAERVMERRHVPFTDADKAIMSHIFEITKEHRNF